MYHCHALNWLSSLERRASTGCQARLFDLKDLGSQNETTERDTQLPIWSTDRNFPGLMSYIYSSPSVSPALSTFHSKEPTALPSRFSVASKYNLASSVSVVLESDVLAILRSLQYTFVKRVEGILPCSEPPDDQTQHALSEPTSCRSQ